MLDLYDEFASLIETLEEAGIDYAVCGGLAMAIHGFPRATVDVDLLAPPAAVEALLHRARDLGYTHPAHPMSFAGGQVQIRRMTKIDSASGDLLSLDILIATASLETVWTGRTRVAWERGKVWVVSRKGLVALKRLRGSGQDQDDIKRLEGSDT